MPGIVTTMLAATLSACGSGTPASTGGNSMAAPKKAAAETIACDHLPDHITLLDDAKVSLCTRGKPFPDRESGTIIYATAKSPADVIDWYRNHAHDAGFNDGISTATTYSVVPKEGKSMMVLTRVVDGGSQVTINWGHTI